MDAVPSFLFSCCFLGKVSYWKGLGEKVLYFSTRANSLSKLRPNRDQEFVYRRTLPNLEYEKQKQKKLRLVAKKGNHKVKAEEVMAA